MLSPSTPIKSAAGCAIIWNKEFNSLTLYKERYHRYRATSSRAVLVGVLGDPSFLPGLFLRHAAGAVRQKANPPSSKIAANCHIARAHDPKAHCSAHSAHGGRATQYITGDAIHFGNLVSSLTSSHPFPLVDCVSEAVRLFLLLLSVVHRSST